MPINRARVAEDVNISSDLYYVVAIEYFDNAAPQTTIWRETFSVPRGTTTAQLQALVVDRGQEIRGALAARDAARTVVPNGTVVTVP